MNDLLKYYVGIWISKSEVRKEAGVRYISVWSGYPRWLLSFFLYIPCWASPCLTYTLLT